MDDQQLSDVMNIYYRPWREIINLMHMNGLPMNATHQQALEWLQQRLALAHDVEIALREYRALEARVSTLEGNLEKECGK